MGGAAPWAPNGMAGSRNRTPVRGFHGARGFKGRSLGAHNHGPPLAGSTVSGPANQTAAGDRTGGWIPDPRVLSGSPSPSYDPQRTPIGRRGSQAVGGFDLERRPVRASRVAAKRPSTTAGASRRRSSARLKRRSTGPVEAIGSTTAMTWPTASIRTRRGRPSVIWRRSVNELVFQAVGKESHEWPLGGMEARNRQRTRGREPVPGRR